MNPLQKQNLVRPIIQRGGTSSEVVQLVNSKFFPADKPIDKKPELVTKVSSKKK